MLTKSPKTGEDGADDTDVIRIVPSFNIFKWSSLPILKDTSSVPKDMFPLVRAVSLPITPVVVVNDEKEPSPKLDAVILPVTFKSPLISAPAVEIYNALAPPFPSLTAFKVPLKPLLGLLASRTVNKSLNEFCI